MADAPVYRVVLRMDVVQNLAEGFEQAWLQGAEVIADEPSNLGQWLSRCDAEDGVYYIVSDWVDERSFREYERSERHRHHRARLHPYRSSGSMTTMNVVYATAGRAAR